MSKFLLDYVFPISVIESIPAASTAFLKQVAIVAKPKSGQEGNVGLLYECTTMTQVAARTDNTEAQQLFNAGMSKVYILLADDLDLTAYLETHRGKFFSLLICSQFTEADVVASQAVLTVQSKLTFTSVDTGSAQNDISVQFTSGASAGAEVVTVVGKAITIQIATGVSTTTQIKAAYDAEEDAVALATVAIESGQGSATITSGSAANLAGGDGIFLGTFDGVTGIATDDESFMEDQAIIDNRCAFWMQSSTGAKNMFFAFGKMLSNLVNWLNQQFVEMPYGDAVDELGEANSLFDKKASFVLEDDEFGKRLGLFCAGGKAIVAPYILKNLRIDMQSRALTWIAANQPAYTVKEAALLELTLQEDVINVYIARGWISEGTISIAADQGNFVATGTIEVPTPKALWRVFNQMTETA